jgi:hypothetical protein
MRFIVGHRSACKTRLPRYDRGSTCKYFLKKFLWTKLPLADRFIIDRKGVIRYAETDANSTVRPEPQHTIEALKFII